MTESNLLDGRTTSSHDICKKSTCRKVQFAEISIRPVVEDERNQGQQSNACMFLLAEFASPLDFSNKPKGVCFPSAVPL